MSGPQRQSARPARQRGLSLVELLVSLLLGLLLAAGMVSAYLGAKRNAYFEDQQARMQENGRYAMRLLVRELEMAGFFGGVPDLGPVPPVPVGTDCSASDWALDGREPLELVNDYAPPAAPETLHRTALTCIEPTEITPGTDLIAVKRTAAQASLYHGVPAAALTPADTQRWFLRTVVGVPDAWERLRPVDLRRPQRAEPTHSYWEAVTRIFFVRPYSEAGGDSVPTLCMETLAGDGMTSRCLVEGVENLQLEFGIDSDGDGVPERYSAAPGAHDMRRVVAVKIHLLLRSIAGLTGYRDTRQYRLGRTQVRARGDSHLRRVVSSTVMLRNRHRPIG